MTLLSMTPAPALRPYQVEALSAIEAARDAGKAAALVTLPTGTGKTVVFVEAIRRSDVPTLVLAHREELLTQAREKLLTIWPRADVGIIGAGHDERGRQITLASVQSAVRGKRLAQLMAMGICLVVVDEAHHTPAKSYQTILLALRAGQPGGPFLLGVTATPQRADGKSLEPIYGLPVYAATLAEMIQARYLSDLKGLQVRTTISLDGVATRAGDFNEEQLSAVINRSDRNRVIIDAYRRHAVGRPALVFAADVQHAHDLAETFREAGIGCEALDGTTAPERRRRILADFASGHLKAICNVGVLTEGYDAPHTSCVILARPTQSRSLYQQMVGRGARPAPGKPDCLIIDVADVSVQHSLTVQSLPKLVGRTGYGLSSDADGDAQPLSLRETLNAALQATGKLVEREADLLAQAFTWRATGGGQYVLVVQGVIFRLDLIDGGYIPRVRFPDGEMQDLSLVPMTLDWSQAVAEQAAHQIQQGQGHLVDRRATWRNAVASPKQLGMMKRLGIKARRTITKGEASDLIAAALAQQSA